MSDNPVATCRRWERDFGKACDLADRLGEPVELLEPDSGTVRALVYPKRSKVSETTRGRCEALLRSTGWVDSDPDFKERAESLYCVLEGRHLSLREEVREEIINKLREHANALSHAGDQEGALFFDRAARYLRPAK